MSESTESIPGAYVIRKAEWVTGGDATWRRGGKMAYAVTDATLALDAAVRAEQQASALLDKAEDDNGEATEALHKDYMNADRAMRDAQQAYDKQPRRFLLAGPPGVGKTIMATELYLHLLEHLPEAYLRPTPLWVDALEYGDAPEARCAVIEKASLLLLDDLGREAVLGRAAVARVVRLIRSRHARDLMTIITTGWTDAQISAEYGGDVLRRLTDRAGTLRWPFPGDR